MNKLNVLFASFEAAPFIKTGGLGDVAAALPGAVQSPDIEVRVVLPKLASIPGEFQSQMQFLSSFYVNLGWRNQYCGLFSLERGGVVWYFLDNEYYFGRPEPYGYFDEAERMAFFAKAVCECCRYLPGFFPDVLHCNDWHTAMAPVFLREFYRYAPEYARMKTIFTIHNLKFQGQYDPYILGDILGLHEIPAARDQLLRDNGRCVNYLAGAVHYSDRVTTVSPTYAREICTPYFGEGVQDLFIERSAVLSGILNGIDTASYNGSRVGVVYGVIDTSYEDAELDKPLNVTLKKMPNELPALISIKYGFGGPAFSLSTACASSAYAIALGKQFIENGTCDMVICGGIANTITNLSITGFNQLLAMSVNPDPATAARPFTKNRDGFIMGEGSGTVVLESEESAKARGAHV